MRFFANIAIGLLAALVLGGIVYFAVGSATAQEVPDEDMLEKCF